MSARLWAMAATVLLLAGCARSNARVQVSDAWARPTTGDASAAAAYLTLESGDGDRLLDVAVDPRVARFAQVHATLRDAVTGELRMQHEPTVPLPPRERVEFAPGRRHVMLMQLGRPLVVGDTLSLVLRFARAQAETVRVPVRDE